VTQVSSAPRRRRRDADELTASHYCWYRPAETRKTKEGCRCSAPSRNGSVPAAGLLPHRRGGRPL